MRKLFFSIIKGTIFFIVSGIITLGLLNIGTMVFQHKDIFVYLKEYNQIRIDLSNSNSGAVGTMASNRVYYSILITFLIIDYILCVYFFYPKENTL